MTRQRIYGEDKPFLAWLRKQDDLPSDSIDFGITVNDADIVVHQFKTPINDAEGTREVQAIMHIETKTRGGLPSDSQVHSLAVVNAFAGEKTLIHNRLYLRNFGAFILVMSGECPETSDSMSWYVFPKVTKNRGPIGSIRYAARFDITKNQLLKILSFKVHPRNLQPNPFRRHHKTSLILETVKMPLGFTVEKPVFVRS